MSNSDVSIQPKTSLLIKIKLYIRSSIFYVGWILSTIFWAMMVLVSFKTAYQKRLKIAQRWAYFNIRWLELTCGINHTITGLENIPKEPAIVLVKHQSTWETLLLQKLFYPQTWVIKRELLWLPFFGWAISLLNPIAINRKTKTTAIKQILKQGLDRLNKGIWVIIFPEGTRVAAGKKERYGMGGPMLASYSGFPILPIAHNAGEHWPRNSFIKHPGQIRVVIGPVISSSNRSPAELRELTEQWIEENVKKISERVP